MRMAITGDSKAEGKEIRKQEAKPFPALLMLWLTNGGMGREKHKYHYLRRTYDSIVYSI